MEAPGEGEQIDLPSTFFVPFHRLDDAHPPWGRLFSLPSLLNQRLISPRDPLTDPRRHHVLPTL